MLVICPRSFLCTILVQCSGGLTLLCLGCCILLCFFGRFTAFSWADFSVLSFMPTFTFALSFLCSSMVNTTEFFEGLVRLLLCWAVLSSGFFSAASLTYMFRTERVGLPLLCHHEHWRGSTARIATCWHISFSLLVVFYIHFPLCIKHKTSSFFDNS